LLAAFSPATSDDLTSIMKLRQGVLGAELSWDDAAYLRWRYLGAPNGASNGHNPTGPLGSAERDGRPANTLWTFRAPDGEVQGVLGIEPLSLHVGGERWPVARYMDVMVEPRLNGLGLGAWMNLMLQERHEIGLAVGATKDSYNLVRRVFHPLAERRSWKLLVRSEDFLRRKTPRLAAVPGLTALADAALGVGRLSLSRGFAFGLEVEPLTSLAGLDDEVDALDASMAAAGLVFTQRSAAYLAWRYLRNPRRRYHLLAARRLGRLAGLLVTRNVGGRGELVDWIWDERLPEAERTQVLSALFARAIEHLARGEASTVWTRTVGLPGERAAAWAGMRRRTERDTVAITAQSPGRVAALASARWFLTLGDSDDD
jgi:hypothetical protein